MIELTITPDRPDTVVITRTDDFSFRHVITLGLNERKMVYAWITQAEEMANLADKKQV